MRQLRHQKIRATHDKTTPPPTVLPEVQKSNKRRKSRSTLSEARQRGEPLRTESDIQWEIRRLRYLTEQHTLSEMERVRLLTVIDTLTWVIEGSTQLPIRKIAKETNEVKGSNQSLAAR